MKRTKTAPVINKIINTAVSGQRKLFDALNVRKKFKCIYSPKKEFMEKPSKAFVLLTESK